MNKEIKEKWLKALRSGEYTQGQGFLKQMKDNTPQYCCLGILCDIAAKEGILEWEQEDFGSPFHYKLKDDKRGHADRDWETKSHNIPKQQY